MSENVQCFRWVFTLHLDDSQDWESTKRDIDTTLQIHCKKWMYQLEKCPTTGRKHFQGRFSLTKKMRMTSLKSLWFTQKVHFEQERGTCEDSSSYCSKADSRIEGPWSFPKVFDQNLKLPKALLPWQQMIADYVKTEPDDRTIIWCHCPD